MPHTTISTEKVRALRERTNSPMMDCKKALIAAKGDIEAAIRAMRESGQLKAEKRADRVTADGLIVVHLSTDHRQAVMIEINSETDFVARDENFRHFSLELSQLALKHSYENVEALLQAQHAGQTVEQSRQALVAKVGENIKVRRLISLRTTEGMISSYTHGGRIGVLVVYKGGDAELGKDLAMHIAASHPIVISPDDVAEEIIEKEKTLFIAQAENAGKPPEVVEKIVAGRIKKFLDEITLLGQPFVKNPDVTVGQLLDAKEAIVLRFVRFAVGEGIQKETSNFADEVAAQAGAFSK